MGAIAEVVTVDVDAGVNFYLDSEGQWGTKPTFVVSKSGFSGEGVFTSGGVERLVKGRVDVTCDYAPATAK